MLVRTEHNDEILRAAISMKEQDKSKEFITKTLATLFKITHEQANEYYEEACK